MFVKFLRKILVLLLLVICSIICIGILPSEAIINFFVDKQQNLRTTPAPRMILIGGSGLIYGLDSPCVEAAFDLPVINAGVHAGLGLRFLLDHVRPYIQPGDIVIVTPEYGVLSRGYHFNAPTTASLVFTDLRDKTSYLSLRDYVEALQGFPAIAYEKVVVRPVSRLYALQNPLSYPPPFYWRKSFNSNGDFIGHLHATKSLPPEALKTYPPLTSGDIEDSVTLLNDFAAYANQHGARAFIAFTPIADTRYQKYATTIAAIYDKLKRELKMPIVSPPSNYIYPIEYFYDTPEHLTARGRKARTEQLIADLKQLQPSITNASTATKLCVDGSTP